MGPEARPRLHAGVQRRPARSGARAAGAAYLPSIHPGDRPAQRVRLGRPPGPLGAAAAPPFPALGAAVGPPLAAPAKLGRRAWRTPPAEVRRRAWLATRSALKALWYAGWLPTLPWWVLRYDRALRSLRQLARQAGCRLLVVATPVPLC